MQTGITTAGVGTIACITGSLGASSANAFSCQAWFSGLVSPVFAAHLHVGTTIGAGGNPTFNFTSAVLWADTPGVFQDHWTGSSASWIPQVGKTFDQQVTDCMSGGCYFNIHTLAHGGGEVACVLQPTTTAVTSVATFGQEAAGGSFAATGTLTFTTAFGTTANQDAVLGYTATFAGLTSSLFQVHIHDSTCTDNTCSGSPFIYIDFNGGNGITSGSITGVAIRSAEGNGITTSNLGTYYQPGIWVSTSLATVAAFQTELAANHTYFNLHTQNNHGGEIRAQLFHTAFSAANGVSAVVPSVLLVAACAVFAFKSQ